MDFDVIVIGTGQAGVPLAVKLAGSGRRVLVCERAALGGTCVNDGCTPTKTMIASATAAHEARTSARLGISTSAVEVDLGAIVDRKDRIVQEWRESVAHHLDSAGERLRLERGHARFVGTREVEVSRRRHRGDVVVINTGARPAIPDIPGLDGVPWLDNRGIMELRTVPPHLLVLGGGYVGCEFAQAFRRFGARVTVLDRSERLLAREDPDVSAALEDVFRAEGIALRLGVRVAGASRRNDGVRLELEGDDCVDGSHLLVATGRRPNSDDLGCDAANIARDERGNIRVDSLYRTSADGVYAVGDVTGGPQFTHAAWDDHRILLAHLQGEARRTRADRIIPHTVFTDPQVAGVGLTETEAREQGVRHESASMPFSGIARATETGRSAGLLKVLVAPDNGRILGAHIVGAEAGELIHVFVALMAARADARVLVDAEVVHPTFAEGVQSVLMKLPRFAD